MDRQKTELLLNDEEYKSLQENNPSLLGLSGFSFLDDENSSAQLKNEMEPQQEQQQEQQQLQQQQVFLIADGQNYQITTNHLTSVSVCFK